MPKFSHCLIIPALLIMALSSTVQAQEETLVMVQPADYPRTVETSMGEVVLHHPVIEDWRDFEVLSGQMAFEVRQNGSEQAWIGSVRLEVETTIDFDERVVLLQNGSVIERVFSDGEPSREIRDMVDAALIRGPRSILLDVLLRALPADFEIPQRKIQLADISFEPPRIVYSETPVQMLVIDGEPVKAPIEDSELSFVVNTNWDLFYHTGKGIWGGERWYVLNNGAWQVNEVLQDEGWEITKRLPGEFKKLPDDENFAGVQAALPAEKPAIDPVPFVISTQPVELIQTEGAPRLVTIPDTNIQYVTNTVSDVFYFEGSYFFLASGRWFSAPVPTGPWSAVAELPRDFTLIPRDHAKGHVLASVPDTPDARAALIEASIPRKALINLSAGTDIIVTYAGDPQFVDIEGTSLKRAANTSYQVIQHGTYYYLCHNAVWFFALDPEGPWTVATQVPDEIYDIPPTDPAHNVTYVYVDDGDATDGSVEASYTAGYTGTITTSVTVVYGTGWYYPPYVYWYPWGYPYYWYFPPCYGFGAWYNPVTGRYGRRAVAYGPYGGVASTAVYNPRTGTYARGRAVWDNDEVARRGYGYNPRNDTFAAGNMYYDFDENKGWRESYVERGDRWAYADTKIKGNTRETEYRTSGGVEGTSTRVREDGVITGEGTMQGENRSATTSSRIDQDSASFSMDGSEGGSLDVSKQRGEESRQISGDTGSGTSFEGESQRTDRGTVNTSLESETGGEMAIRRDDGNRSFVGETGDGDMYAGRNGSVYKKGDDGWQKYDNGNWSSVDRGEANYNADRASSQYRSGQYDRNQAGTTQMDRQYDARQSGQANYNKYQQQRATGYNRSPRRMGRGRRW